MYSNQRVLISFSLQSKPETAARYRTENGAKAITFLASGS